MFTFASIDFFILFAILAIPVWLLKGVFAKLFRLEYYLFAVLVIYIVFFFSHPWHACFFGAGSYLIFLLLTKVVKAKNVLWGSLLLALPMIGVKVSTDLSLLSFAGLSYITFRSIQVYIDFIPGSAVPSPIRYLLFLLFPPTILIGPIDRYQRFTSDLDKNYAGLNTTALVNGFNDIALGLLQKFVLAELVNRFFLSQLDTTSNALGDMAATMYVYILFLYFDFAGYSNIACGLSKLFGIQTPYNFNFPLIAYNPPDFWKKWHITLGDWLRDYIFTPYYKWVSRMKRLKEYPLLRQNTGLFLTFLVMGCWNGFQLNYIASGCLFGLFSVVYNTYIHQCRKKQRDIVFGKMNPTVVRVISAVLMFNLTAFAIYLFSGYFPFLK